MAQAVDAEVMSKFNGLTRELINFPQTLREIPGDLEFADEDVEVEVLTPDDCVNFIQTICGTGHRLVQEGAIKYKLADAQVEGSEWLRRYRSLVNAEESAVLKEDTNPQSPKVTDSSTTQVNKSCGGRKSKRIAARISQTSFKKSAITVKAKGATPSKKKSESKDLLKLKRNFVMLKEIRNLGRHMFRQKHHKPDAALKLLPQLKGITMGQLEDFYDSVFGICVEGDLESEKSFVRRYYQILESLPVDPGGVIKGANGTTCGLLVPYIHSFDNVSVNNDEEITGLDMDCIEGALLRHSEKRVKGKRVGAIQGINNAMMFYGVSGSTFPEHVEDGNAIGSINTMPYGRCFKFWKIANGEYCNIIRANVKRVLKELIKDGLEDDLAKDSEHICVLQHKEIILSPPFYDLCKPHPVPYKIFFQRRSELMLIGTAVHHGGASAGVTTGRATNIIPPDYHLSLPLGFVQCPGHGRRKDLGGLAFSTETIEKFRKDSINQEKFGMEKKIARAVEVALIAQQATHSAERVVSQVQEVLSSCSTVSEAEKAKKRAGQVETSGKKSKKAGFGNWKRGKERVVGKLSSNFKCHECGKCFHQRNDLDCHVRFKSCRRNTRCETCGTNFYYYRKYLEHKERCISPDAEEEV